ncbi:MAG: nuclear transport factor 2 family protein [Acidimicrobiia bacterium]
MSTFTRQELERAFEHHDQIALAQDWNAYTDLFTPDGVYVEHHFGVFTGRDAIRAWLVPIMEPLANAGWEYPTDWVVFDGDRVVYRWWNRLPNPDGRARPYQFPGITVLQYAGDDLWSFQEDFYNWEEVEATLSDYTAGIERGKSA